MPGRRNKQRLGGHWRRIRPLDEMAAQLASVFNAFSEIFHVNIGFC
jgi:hypothetical protein